MGVQNVCWDLSIPSFVKSFLLQHLPRSHNSGSRALVYVLTGCWFITFREAQASPEKTWLGRGRKVVDTFYPVFLFFLLRGLCRSIYPIDRLVYFQAHVSSKVVRSCYGI